MLFFNERAGRTHNEVPILELPWHSMWRRRIDMSDRCSIRLTDFVDLSFYHISATMGVYHKGLPKIRLLTRLSILVAALPSLSALVVLFLLARYAVSHRFFTLYTLNVLDELKSTRPTPDVLAMWRKYVISTLPQIYNRTHTRLTKGNHTANECRFEHPVCFNCKEWGHRSSECYHPRGSGRLCDMCGQTGHIRSRCPFKSWACKVSCAVSFSYSVSYDIFQNCNEFGHSILECSIPRAKCTSSFFF